MNSLENELDYCLGRDAPAPGQAIGVAPGVKWARMRLPFALDHVNVWLLRDELGDEEDDRRPPRQGWSIVDCGIDDEATRRAWEQLFATALDDLPVLRVIVTHMHPDHIGSAHWLCERWNARLWISATDYNLARLASSASAGFGGPMSAEFMARHGLPRGEATEHVAGRRNYYRNLVPDVPPKFHRLLDGDAVAIGSGDARTPWKSHVGYGHAPEHMSFHSADRGIFISGDMVLPRISTNVSVVDVEPESNPLKLYLDSIARMRSVDPSALVLPSHGLPFKGLHTRIGQLEAHHAERLAEVLVACAREPQSAFDLLPVLFRRALDPHQMTFAMGESLAHLHTLWHEGRLVRSVGESGVYRFAARG